MLSKEFKTNTPVLPDVKIIEEWARYDGPLFGVCKVNGKKFFFMDVIYDIWRYYDDDTSQRLWCIYAVYDIDMIEIKKIMQMHPFRENWDNKIAEESNCIGIFWEYENDR